MGGPHNSEFNDCTLENFEYGPEEVELGAYCRENGIPLRFDDLRGHVYDVPYEKYLEHLVKFKEDPDGDFTDYEFIVPVVRCSSLHQAMQLVDWIDKAQQRETIQNILSGAEKRASEQVDVVDGAAVRVSATMSRE